MCTASSAMRTTIDSASADEYTATVLIPSSLQARVTRTAISPRLAIRTFSNTLRSPDTESGVYRLEVHQHLVKLNPLSVADQNLGDAPTVLRGHLVHNLHGLDNGHRLARLDNISDFDAWL